MDPHHNAKIVDSGLAAEKEDLEKETDESEITDSDGNAEDADHTEPAGDNENAEPPQDNENAEARQPNINPADASAQPQVLSLAGEAANSGLHWAIVFRQQDWRHSYLADPLFDDLLFDEQDAFDLHHAHAAQHQ